MDQALEFINSHIELAPLVIFFLLLLAGLNLPVSEDLFLFTSALLAVRNPEHLVALFLGVYLGAYFSDLISYALGRYLGPQLFKIKFFNSMASPERLESIRAYFEKYGIFTLIIGRFIPFGVRNGLFISCGLSKMKFLKFALYDFIACTLSCSLFFYLYYSYGEPIVEIIKKGNIIIFSCFLLVLIGFFIKKKTKKISS